MKHVLLLLFGLLLSLSGFSQLTITEIMYNPPESGSDTLEYVELYNHMDTEVNLKNFKLKETKTYDLPDSIVGAGKYIVVGGNAAALKKDLNIDAINLDGMALSNSGEKISILSLSGDVVDEVTYGRDAPWPTFMDGANGGGASIELCNLESDNSKGGNWKASTNNLGIKINNKDVKGTPSAANSTTCEESADHTIEVLSNQFSPSELTIKVGESVQWVNKGGFHNVNGKQDVYSDNPESFFSGAASTEAWTFIHTFTKAGQYTYQCDPHAGIGMVGNITVEESGSGIPTYTIGQINDVNADGVADSIGVKCKTKGIVHGENLNGRGLQFSLIDNGEGIGVYAQSENFGYTVQEGDEVEVTGEVNQFRGLTQVKITDLKVLSSGNDLMTPLEISTMGEENESLLVLLDGYTYEDVSQWKGDGSSFNVKMTNGTDVIALRIDSDSQLASMAAPEDIGSGFKMVGLVGQYDTQAPYTEGYQLFPRSAADFIPKSSSVDAYDVSKDVEVYPIPAASYIEVKADQKFDVFIIYDANGRSVMKGYDPTRVDISSLRNGQYTIVLIGDAQRASKSIMKI